MPKPCAANATRPPSTFCARILQPDCAHVKSWHVHRKPHMNSLEISPIDEVPPNSHEPMLVGLPGPGRMWERLGVSVLDGIAMWESDGPYDVIDQELGGSLMLGLTPREIPTHPFLANRAAQKRRIANLLEPVDGRASGLLRHQLTQPEPVMRITRIGRRRLRFTEIESKVGELITLGWSNNEIGRELQFSAAYAGRVSRNTAGRLGLPHSKGLVASGLLLADQVALPDTAFAVPRHEATAEPPKLIQIVRSRNPEGQTQLGIGLLGGVALFEPRHPRLLTPRRQETALLALTAMSVKEISKHDWVSIDTVKSHVAFALAVTPDVHYRHNLLLGFLRSEPPMMKIYRFIEPGTLRLTPTIISIGRCLARNLRYDEIGQALSLSTGTVKGMLQQLPNGLRGRTELITVLTLGGYLNDLLPEAAISRVARRPLRH